MTGKLSLLIVVICCNACYSLPSAQKTEYIKPQLQQSSVKSSLPNEQKTIQINDRKFTVLQKNAEYWLLQDLENGAQCTTSNQIVIQAEAVLEVLKAAGIVFEQHQVSALAKDTYLLTVPFSDVVAIHSALKKVKDIKVEWRLIYLGLPGKAES